MPEVWAVGVLAQEDDSVMRIELEFDERAVETMKGWRP